MLELASAPAISCYEIMGIRRSIKLKTAASVMECDEKTVRKLMDQGLIEGHKLGGRDIRVYADSIESYRNNNKVLPQSHIQLKARVVVNTAAHRNAMASLKRRGII